MSHLNRYGLFVDESGHALPTSIDPNCPHLTVCGVLFTPGSYKAFHSAFRQLKIDFFGTSTVIFHSRDIRKKQGVFKILQDEAIDRAFIQALNDVIIAADFRIISAVIDKIAYAKKYPLSSYNLYNIALEFIMERSLYHVDSVYNTIPATVKIIAESRGANEDKPLLSAYNRILDKGNDHNPSRRLQRVFTGLEFKRKKELISGLELADLCAYPIGRFAANPLNRHPSFYVVEQKLLRKKKNYDGVGIKRFPVLRD